MRIEIKTEKVHTINGQGRKILEVGLEEPSRLPKEYFEGAPFVNLSTGKDLYGRGDLNGVDFGLAVGETYSEEAFQRIIEWVRAAGKRLGEIKARIRAELAEWQGEETFVI